MKTMQVERTWTFVAVLAVLASCAPVLTCLAAYLPDEFIIEYVRLDSNRLLKNVIPTHYNIFLDLTKFNVKSEPLKEFPFEGSVEVGVAFVGNTASGSKSSRLKQLAKWAAGSSKSTRSSKSKATFSCKGFADEIVMHADRSLEIRSLGVYSPDGVTKPPEELKINKILVDRTSQLIVLCMAKKLPVGKNGVIKFKYSASSSTDLHGLFVTSLNDRGTVYPQLVAKFRPAFARLVLPCFDEPSFKARFSLNLRHHPIFTALANMPVTSDRDSEGMIVSTFEETPVMPIHMVAFTLAQYEPFPFNWNVHDDLKLRIFTPPGYADQGGQALHVAAKAIIWFEKFIDIPFPLKKLDVVAIGDMDTGNTETWGLVFLKDEFLFVDRESAPESRITTTLNVAHVVVHQWFGNLITAEWWSELWITEMVAAHMAFQFVAEEYPIYQSEYFVRISLLSGVLNLDKLSSAHALVPSDNRLAYSDRFLFIFDSITFTKSAAMGRLLQNILGAEQFCSALKWLARQKPYRNVNFNDLVNAISQNMNPHADMNMVHSILKTWPTVVSYPVINVNLDQNTGKVYLYQEIFHEASEEVLSLRDSQHFTNCFAMPLKILVADAKGNHQKTIEVNFKLGGAAVVQKLPFWFNPNEHYLKVNPNPDISTYYRIRYSDHLLRLLREPIKRKQIAPMERLHILNDADALVNSELLKIDTFKELVSWYSDENDWAIIIQLRISEITISHLTTDPRPEPTSSLFKRIFSNNIFFVRGSESLLEQTARSVILNSLIAKKDQDAISACVEAFERQTDNGAHLAGMPIFLREPVYTAVVKAGSQEQQLALVEHIAESNSHEERLRLAKNLVLTKNLHVLTRLVDMLPKSGFKRPTLQMLVSRNWHLGVSHDNIVYIRD